MKIYWFYTGEFEVGGDIYNDLMKSSVYKVIYHGVCEYIEVGLSDVDLLAIKLKYDINVEDGHKLSVPRKIR